MSATVGHKITDAWENVGITLALTDAPRRTIGTGRAARLYRPTRASLSFRSTDDLEMWSGHVQLVGPRILVNGTESDSCVREDWYSLANLPEWLTAVVALYIPTCSALPPALRSAVERA